MKLFIKLLFKIPEIPMAISMIHICIKRTIMACGSTNNETLEITDFYTKELIGLEQYTDADAVYMKHYNSCVSEVGQKNIVAATLAYKIGLLNFNFIKNYNFAVSMFQRALIGYELAYGTLYLPFLRPLFILLFGWV
jgi:hypothetical protein